MINLIGKTLGNRYLIINKIGEGGMALVYKAKDELLGRYVAIKILRPEYTADEEFVKKFKRESLAAASLSHSNIVGIYDVGEQEGIYYIVMEYIDGQTLKSYISSKQKLGYEETLKIARQIALALEHAHKNGVVHRDIKPHNILMTEDGVIKVTDFGIARASTSATMTNTGKVLGSVHYFSPEQARGGYSDQRTDIYSLGVVMYEMLTGTLPYDAESPITVALKHIQDSLVEPIKIDPTIPTAVNDIVIKAMDKDMGKRYQNARELIEDIDNAKNNPNMSLYNAADDQSTRVIPVEKIDEAIKKSSKPKKRVIIPVVIITAALLLIFAGAYAAFNRYFAVDSVNIPEIMGMDEKEAEELLKEKNLKMTVYGRKNDKAPKGQIIDVKPDTGTSVKEGFEVMVQVSEGEKLVKVPDLTNMDIIDAELKISNLDLKRGKIENKNSETVKEGLIISQSIPKDQEVPVGTVIDLVLSRGPETKPVIMPVLAGKTLEQVKEILAEKNLKLGTISTGYDEKYVDGVVIGQGVEAGTQILEGQVISIRLNKVEKPTPTVAPTPEVTEKPEDEEKPEEDEKPTATVTPAVTKPINSTPTPAPTKTDSDEKEEDKQEE